MKRPYLSVPFLMPFPTASLATIACGLILVSGLTRSLVAQDSDKLYPVTGVAVTGKITEMTPAGVVMEVRGVKENFQSIGIQRIVYEGEPSSLTRAKEAVLATQFDEALELLKKVDFKSITRDEIKKEFLYYVGLVQAQLAMAGQGDPQKAETALIDSIRNNAQSFHFYEASSILGSLAATVGGYDRAANYFNALSKSPYPSHKLNALYQLGNSNLALGKIAEARAAFTAAQGIVGEDANSKRLQKLAGVGLLRCDTAEKKVDEAIDKLRKLVSESDTSDSDLFARLYNALGEAHLAAGQEEEAILAYLHTDLLFTSNADSHAEALYHLIRLYSKLDPPRVADTKSKLQSLYANSAWAKKS